MSDNMKKKTKLLPTTILTAWASMMDDIAKAAIIGIGAIVWATGYEQKVKNFAIIGLMILAAALIYGSCLIRIYLADQEKE